MCGRYMQDSKNQAKVFDAIVAYAARRDEERQTEQEALDAQETREREAREFISYSIAPTNLAPVVTSEGLGMSQWGFLRNFGGKKQNLINARLDRVATARTWKKPLLTSRCLVPIGGYYEWVDRKPWFISNNDQLFAAGLYEQKDDDTYFTILTTEGRDEAGRVHDRMPVFLAADLQDDWLGGELTESAANDLIGDADDSVREISRSLDAWRVSTRVNTVRVDKSDAGLIERVEDS